MVETPHLRVPDPTSAQPASSPRRRQRRAWRWGGLGLGIITTAALLVTFSSPRNQDESPLVLVAGYEPIALGVSYPVLGDILADWVAFRLGSTGQVRLVDGSTRIHTLLGGNEARHERLQILAEETGARWLLGGEYFQVWDSLVVVTRVSDAGSEAVIHTFRTAMHASEDHATLVDRVSSQALEWVRTATGSRRAAPDIQPPDYGAYVDYLAGAQHWVEGTRHMADPLFRSALAADPRMAGPMAWLIGALDPTWPWKWRDSLAESLTSREAILPPSDRALVGWWQARRGEDPARALEAARASVRAAPASSDAKWWAALAAAEMGQSEAAAELFEQLRPGFDRLSSGIVPYAVMETGAWAFHEVGDYPAELAWIERFAADRFAGPLACRRTVSVRALMDPEIDFDEAASGCASESTTSLAMLSARLRLDAATELRAHGAIGHADRIAKEAIIQYEQAAANEPSPILAAAGSGLAQTRAAVRYWGNLGNLKLLTRDWLGSRQAFTHAIALEGNRSRWLGGLGVALALGEEAAESERVLDRLRTANDPALAYEQARIHASLGQTAEANAILDGLRPARHPVRARLRYDVAFDGMRKPQM